MGKARREPPIRGTRVSRLPVATGGRNIHCLAIVTDDGRGSPGVSPGEDDVHDHSEKLTRAQSQPLNETQRALVEKKLEILRGASFGFTQDRLLHIQAEDLRSWTDECVDELRRRIASAAPLDYPTSFRLLEGRSQGIRAPAPGGRPSG